MTRSRFYRDALAIGAASIFMCGASYAQDVTSITVKIGNTCGAKYNELFVQIQDGPRVRVKPDLTALVPVKAGTKLRVKQSEESVTLKVDGIWTEAVDGTELLTRCLR